MSEAEAAALFEEGLARLADARARAFIGLRGEHALREANAKLVGPQGELTRLLKLMPGLPKERRRELGQAANAIEQEITALFEAALAEHARAKRLAELEGPPIDVTLPGRGARSGRLHPLTRTIHELLDVFVSLGFEVADAPELELAENNFEKLGFPPDHPATDMQDSFFVDAGAGRARVLRTHTTPIQVHQMTSRPPPMAVVCPGAVYRRDDDATHSPMFAQIDGFVVDEGITFAHLKGVLTCFLQRMFGDEVPVRFRPSYFPFVEPGGEVDMGCMFCQPWTDSGARTPSCRVCKATGWMEILGCGMIHPVVFEACGVDAARYTGFAFGMGIDRIAMLRHGVSNIRLLYENDARFLAQL